MLNNKLILATILATASINAFAAEPVQFNVEATIPSSDFYVVPNGDWNIKGVTLNYNPTASALTPVNVGLKAKNTNGGINAYLESEPQLMQASGGSHVIPLNISMAGKKLLVGSTEAQEILTEEQAANETALNVQIGPDTGATYEPGDYLGTVTMMFDATPAA